jgi:hypothetical protein
VLVVCNGPFKSGSTWVYEISRLLVDPQQLPRTYADPVWLPQESIPQDRLADFVAETDLRGHEYVIKVHVGRPQRIEKAIASDDVIVVDVRRDLRDVVVSAYHHFRALGTAPEDFSRFYWTQGRYYAAGVCNHHRRWEGRTDLTLQYESLITNFDQEAGKLATVLGRETSTEELARIQEEVGLSKLRQRYSDSGISGMDSSQFFRSGTPGGWSTYLDDAMLDDLGRIGERGLPFRQRVGWFLRSRTVSRRLRG